MLNTKIGSYNWKKDKIWWYTTNLVGTKYLSEIGDEYNLFFGLNHKKNVVIKNNLKIFEFYIDNHKLNKINIDGSEFRYIMDNDENVYYYINLEGQEFISIIGYGLGDFWWVDKEGNEYEIREDFSSEIHYIHKTGRKVKTKDDCLKTAFNLLKL